MATFDQTPLPPNPSTSPLSSQPSPPLPLVTAPFRLRRCSYNGRDKLILSHHASTTPPPLVPLFNYLVLTETVDSKSQNNAELEQLWKSLLLRALKDRKKLSREDFLNFLDVKHFMSDTTLKPIRTESTKHFVDPEDDETKLLVAICKSLDIKLHHGSLVDPEDPENCEGQLTPYGLMCLNNDIEEGKLGVLFRKNHLSVVRKHCGSLFVLETNIDNWGKWDDPMWRTLKLSDHEEALFTSLFSPIAVHLQPNAKEKDVVQFINQWKQEEESRKKEQDDFTKSLVELEGNISQAQKSSGSKRNPKKKTTRDKHVDQQDQGSMVEKKEESTGAETIAQIPSAGHIDDGDEYKWIRGKFWNFLETFVDPDDDVPDGDNTIASYVRMVTTLKAQEAVKRSNLVVFYYPQIKSHDPVLAFAILKDRTRLNDILSQVFLEFRVKHKCGKREQLRGKVRLRIHDLPPAESIPQRFSDFLSSNNIKLAEQHIFYDGQKVNSPTYIGRRTGKGYIDYILENHRDGKSWNGEWEMSDMVVKNGQFQILKGAKEPATSNSMRNDFLKLIAHLFKLYKTEDEEKAPAYFDIFHIEVLKNMDLYDDDLPKFRLFQRYLSHHLAFKSPLVRSALFCEVFIVIQSLRTIMPNGKRAVFDRLKSSAPNFVDKTENAWEFSKVYRYDGSVGPENRYMSCLQINFLEFLRHLNVHLLDHTRVMGVQQVNDIVHVDLMIGDTYEEEVSTLVFEMMEELTDAPFSSSWRHYEMFECGDKLENAVFGSGKEKNVQSGGMENSASGSGEVNNAQ